MDTYADPQSTIDPLRGVIIPRIRRRAVSRLANGEVHGRGVNQLP